MEEKTKIGIGMVIMKSFADAGGNKDIIDTKKSFNIALDENDNAISITN